MKTVDQVIDKMNSTPLVCQDENGIFELRDIGDGKQVVVYFDAEEGLIKSKIE